MGSEARDNEGLRSGSAASCNAVIAAIKTIGCIAVVVGHCDNRYIACSMAAVAGFMSVSVAGVWSRPWHDLLVRAAWTLALFVVWSGVYTLWFSSINIYADRPIFGKFFHDGSVIVSAHLWYLPAVAMILVCLCAFGQRGRLKPSASAIWIPAAAAAAAVCWQGEQSHLAIATLCLASVMIGIAVLPDRSSAGVVLGLAMVSVSLICIEVLFGIPLRILSVGSVAGCVVAAFRYQCGRGASLLGTASELTGGVYLVHMIPLFMFRHWGLSGPWLMVCTLVASVLVVAAAACTPASAWCAVKRRRAGSIWVLAGWLVQRRDGQATAERGQSCR